MALRNSPATHSFVKNCTIAANVWTQFVIPVPACTLGTWLIDNTLSAQLSFAAMAGSTFTGGVDNTWTAGSFIATPQISNWMSAASQLFEFTNVGLYLDDQATGAAPPWVMPDEAQELQACRRYYAAYATQYLVGGWSVGAGTPAYGNFSYQVQMRANPAVALGSTSLSGASSHVVAAIAGDSMRTTATSSNSAAAFYGSANLITCNSRM